MKLLTAIPATPFVILHPEVPLIEREPSGFGELSVNSVTLSREFLLGKLPLFLSAH